MIALLTGTIVSVSLNSEVIIEVNGVGYKVLIPEKDAIHQQKGEFSTLHISTHVREDSITLFGFQDGPTRELFDKLVSVSGIGGKLALAMISVLSPEGIIQALDTSDVDMLCRVPGIGKKSAQRMIVELSNMSGIKDIFGATEESLAVNDVRDALEELGYRRDEIVKVLREIDSSLSVDVMIKDALRVLGSS